ncbi:MAG: uncharacterized protein A8A55_2696, partial [Amphiamblys sp. WSBS2006]
MKRNCGDEAVRQGAVRQKTEPVLRSVRRTLANPHIPVYHKALVIQGIVLPTMLYGAEIDGSTTRATKNRQRAVNRALEMVAGRGVALKALGKELHLPGVKAAVLKQQWRAVEELPKKRTVVAKLVKESRGRWAWRPRSLREIKRAERKCGQKISTGKELMDAWNERELLRDKASASKWYRENTSSGFGVSELSVKFPELARGWRNVLRIISGYLWTVPRLVRAKLI